MNSIVIILSALVVILTISAIITTKPRIRIISALLLFFLLVGSIVFSIDAAARRVITASVQKGTYTKDFGEGVRSLRTALGSSKIILVLCGAGLFLISFNTKHEKTKGQ